MNFNSTVEFLAEDECLSDSSENTVVRFTPSELVNDLYKSNHSIKYVKSGYEEYVIDGKYEKLSDGETMLVNGGRDVSAQSCGEAIAIFLEDELVNEVSRELIDGDRERSDISGKESIERIDARNFNSIWNKLYAEPELILTEEFYYEVGAIYTTSFAQNAEIEESSGFKSQAAMVANSDKLQIAKSFIFDNIDHKVTLEEIAREAAMSKFHLLRSFKQFYGVTPLRLHLWLRLNRAKALLRSDRHSASEVAYLMNYADLATFSKQFKREIGISPSYFVKNRN
ncbi:MAG: AraC family transcriptional regulator [Cyclobacteriaceae bacterium]